MAFTFETEKLCTAKEAIALIKKAAPSRTICVMACTRLDVTESTYYSGSGYVDVTLKVALAWIEHALSPTLEAKGARIRVAITPYVDRPYRSGFIFIGGVL